MEYKEAKKEFIQAWGILGTSWGINKTMAQIFALLLITPEKLTVEEIMDELTISRGNASMNLRALIDWRLIQKTSKLGERKEYFHCDGDIWALSAKVAEERRKREVKPLVSILEKVHDIKDVNKETTEFRRVTMDLLKILENIDLGLDIFSKQESSWFFKTISTLRRSGKKK